MFTRDLWLKSRGSAILDLGESELVRSPDLFNLQLEGVFVRVVFHDVVVHVDQNPGKIKNQACGNSAMKTQHSKPCSKSTHFSDQRDLGEEAKKLKGLQRRFREEPRKFLKD